MGDLNDRQQPPPSAEAEDPVKAQYEFYPYPPRNPADESIRLLRTSLDSLAVINHNLFGGMRSYGGPFRALVAGGGTGDSLVYLAQQLADEGTQAEVVYLDVSKQAGEIAQARVRKRGLSNVRFVTGSLLDLDSLELGEFDYVNCSGVLHHLADPLRGLRALVESLAPDGGLGLMVYGALGRTGVYPVRQMLQTLAPATLPFGERVSLAKRLIAALPETNWLKRNPFIDDYAQDDADLVDLLLNARDRAYCVEQVREMLREAGLRLVSFIPRAWYEPQSFVRDPLLREMLDRLDDWDRAAFAERFTGGMKRHMFYAVRTDNRVTPPTIDDPTAIPVSMDLPPIEAANEPQAVIHIDGPYFRGTTRMSALSAGCLRLVNGRRSMAEIAQAMGIEHGRLVREFADAYRFLHDFGHIYLRRAAL